MYRTGLARPRLWLILSGKDPVLQFITGRDRPLVSIVIPVFDEEPILESHLVRLLSYLDSLSDSYSWEVIIVNDGSRDATGEIAERIAAQRDDVRVLHHRMNFGLGQALQYAFGSCNGRYVLTLDIDLSYAPDHIESILQTLTKTGAKLVLASPYMKGGKISQVPVMRRILSVCANRFLSLAARGNLSTLTGMVRGYDGRFVRGLHLRSQGPEVNPEVVYKAMLLHARIEEIPAHLSWSPQLGVKSGRASKLSIFRQMTSVMLFGFLFRPVAIFILPGLSVLSLGVYSSIWTFIHFFTSYASLVQISWIPLRASSAIADAFGQFPHTFFVAGVSMVLAVQLLGLGILSLQSKSYFEEQYHLGWASHVASKEEES